MYVDLAGLIIVLNVYLAYRNGRSMFAWFLLSLVFGAFATGYLLVAGPIEKPVEPKPAFYPPSLSK
jgi:hypothetical protein